MTNKKFETSLETKGYKFVDLDETTDLAIAQRKLELAIADDISNDEIRDKALDLCYALDAWYFKHGIVVKTVKVETVEVENVKQKTKPKKKTPHAGRAGVRAKNKKPARQR